MTDKERLNSILRLRLFFSTEKELSDYVGYQLRGNHFNRFKDFACSAYFCKFAQECSDKTAGRMSLSLMLSQYKALSKFYKRFIENTSLGCDMSFIIPLLDYIMLGKKPEKKRFERLCEYYDSIGEDRNLDSALLLLLTYSIIPTYSNKVAQDIVDIKADFQKAYDILCAISQSNRDGNYILFCEIAYLKEMRQIIAGEHPLSKVLNRTILINTTSCIIGILYTLKQPELLLKANQDIAPLTLNLPRFWHKDGDADNVVWEMTPLNIEGLHALFRNEIDFKNHRIMFTHFQLMFYEIDKRVISDYGSEEICYTFIQSQQALHNIFLHREVTNDLAETVLTRIKYGPDGKTVSELSLGKGTPLGNEFVSLEAVKEETKICYYENYIDNKNSDFENVNTNPESAICLNPIDAAVSPYAIMFNFDGEIYKLDKYDEQGNETIEGISALTHKENFLYIEVIDGDSAQSILALDSISQYLNLDELSQSPYFHKIDSAAEIFYQTNS